MDGDLLSPKRKRSGRAIALKKSNAISHQISTPACNNIGSTMIAQVDKVANKFAPQSMFSHQEDSLPDNSPIKARRYSGPNSQRTETSSKILSPRLTRGLKSIVGRSSLEGLLDEKARITPPRSPSSSFTHNTTFDSSSIIRRCDDTTVSSFFSPGSSNSSSFMREAATEKKTNAGIEEKNLPVRKSDSENNIPRMRATEKNLESGDARKAINTSDYSPQVVCRKLINGHDVQPSSSSSGMHGTGTVFKRPNFTCPGSENLRHARRSEDEWRSSYEGEDGESDEEEKSGNSSSCVMDRMKLKFSARPLFENESSVTNSRFSDDDEHQQMDSNMSCMALYVAKDMGKSRMKSRTIFDCEPPPTEDFGPQFLSRRSRGGRDQSRDNPIISDDSTSFVDALALSGNMCGGLDDAVNNNRSSFTSTIQNPFAYSDMNHEDIDDADSSLFGRSRDNEKGSWCSSPSQAETRKSKGGGYNMFSSASSFSPDDSLHTPARCAVAAAASMGDLGTPVTEAGSPADIDMGAAYDPYVEGEEGEDKVFGYRASRHSARHEEAFMKGRSIGSRSPDQLRSQQRPNNGKDEDRLFFPAHSDAFSDHEDMLRYQRQRADSYDSSETESQIIDAVSIKGKYSDKSESQDCRSASTDKEFSHLDGIYQQSNGAFSSKNDYSLSSNGANVSSTRAAIGPPRPQPDQSAFSSVGGKTGGGGDCPSTPMRALNACPATPMRTPTWAAAERAVSTTYSKSDEERDSHNCEWDRGDGNEHHSLITRQNSLNSNKVLLSLSNSLDTSDVSFRRDFEQEGFLGSGTFADVYRAREKDGKSYAVKKSKRQFRSKKDRHLLMGEVMIMKKLGEVHCEYIVQLIRAWQEGGYFYVQIDLAERGTLKDLLCELATNNSEPEDATVWHILHDVTCGLQHIHNCGVVHLDVKPANLLISIEGVIKIGDFGTAADLGKGEDGHEGDTRYMAHELLDSSDRYPPADIYSLGLTLYEACISCTPQHREAVAQGDCPLPSEGPLWHVLRDGDAPAPQGRDPELCAVIRAAMRYEPLDRPSTKDILALPDVRDVVQQRFTQAVLRPVRVPSSEPHQLARAASFIESMSTAHHTSMQLLEAGNTSSVPPLAEQSERALTPTGTNGGSISFWKPMTGKKWESKDKETEQDEDPINAISIASTMEYSPALNCVSSSASRNFRGKTNSLNCTSSTGGADGPLNLDTSSCKYDCTDWTVLSPSALSPSRCPSGAANRSLRHGAVSFPLPGSNRRRDVVFVDTQYPPKSKAITKTTPASPVDAAKGSSIFRDNDALLPPQSTVSSVAKFRYADSNSSGSGLAPSCKGSISVGNVFSSAGLEGYRPGVSSVVAGGPDWRKSSISLRRAGLETVSSNESICSNSIKEG